MRAGQHFAVAKSLTPISLSDSNESEAGAAGRSEKQHAAGPVVGLAFTLATHGLKTERLEVLQAAELLKRFGAAVDLAIGFLGCDGA